MLATMIGSPYREDLQALQRFGQHLGVAESLLDQFQSIPDRLPGDATHDGIEQLKRDARVAWEGLWDQLTQARAIAHSLGRDVEAYDRARKAAADIWLSAVDVDIGPWERTISGHRRTITWKSAPLRPAQDAIAALKAVLPEAVTTTSPPIDTDLRSHRWLRNYGALILLGLIVAFIVWRCAS